MAKAMSADQLETLLTTVLSKTIPEIMSKVLDKFETCFDKLMAKFDEKLDRYYGDLHDTNIRLDKIEKCCADIRANDRSADRDESRSTPTVQKADPALQVLMAMETEKAERVKRQRNVIITGLPEVHGVTDDIIFSKFCEENLTVKPTPVHCRRVGRVVGDKPKKLKVTLESDSAVDDLISSSHILRAHDSTQRQVYFNRDLTPLEAQSAFEFRQSRKTKVAQPTGLTNSP